MRNIDRPIWTNDGKQVCFHGKPVRGADPKTFEVLLGNYARDAQNVFFHRIRASKIDRATFLVLNANFGVDSSRAYFVVTPIRYADPQTFRVLDSSFETGPLGFLQKGYVADAKSVWYVTGSGVRRLDKADPKTFVSLGNGYGFDSEHVFFHDLLLLGADRTTWRPWHDLLSVDKDSVYWTDKKVPDVDRASIWKLASGNCFMDRHRIYCGIRTITAEEYLEQHLKNVEAACARERESLPNGKLFDRVLDEWPQYI